MPSAFPGLDTARRALLSTVADSLLDVDPAALLQAPPQYCVIEKLQELLNDGDSVDEENAAMYDAIATSHCTTFLSASISPLQAGEANPAAPEWELWRGSQQNLLACEQYPHWPPLQATGIPIGPLVAAWLACPVPDVLIIRRRDAASPPILRATVEVRWLLRNERVATISTAARALARECRGPVPQRTLVTGEWDAFRLASIALGTGDLDCTYHFALPELQAAVEACGNSEAADLVNIMVEGKRLKDISDLPLDLAV